MNQPNLSTRIEEYAIEHNIPATVAINGTRRKVRVGALHPYTIECITKIWLERDIAQAGSGEDVVKSLCVEPYFAVKEACLIVLNGFFKIKFIYPIMWRVWAYLRGYTDGQMLPIIEEGKKKLPLTAHWKVMAFSTDMRTDWMRMTGKEAEQYRAELLSAASRLS